jgi:hypothetical protein
VRRALAAGGVAAFVLLCAPSGQAVRSKAAGSFPISFTGMVSWHRNVDDAASGIHEVDDWSLQVKLERSSKSDDQAGYTGSGKGSFSMVGVCCGGCSWQAGPADVTADATLTIQPARTGKGFEYSFQGGNIVELPYKITCPVNVGTNPPTVRSSVGWQTDERPFSGSNIQGQLESFPDPQVHGVYRWQLNGKPDPDDLTANAGGPYEVPRAHHVTLDGSASTGKIVSYKWQIGPDADCHGAALKRTAHTGVTWNIVPLCSLHATLTVADKDGKTARAVTVVGVNAREWQTPDVKHRTAVAQENLKIPGSDLLTAPITGYCNAPNDCHLVPVTVGLNAVDPASCAGKIQEGSSIFCPLLNGKRSWRGNGYTIGTVQDADGPFDGDAYVTSTSFHVDRVGYINPNVRPDAEAIPGAGVNFYNYNLQHGMDIAGYLAAVEQHEGFGAPGKPGTGHSQKIQDAIHLPGGGSDPRHVLEALFAPDAAALQRKADQNVKEIDDEILRYMGDPLVRIGTFNLYVPVSPANGGNYEWMTFPINVGAL